MSSINPTLTIQPQSSIITQEVIKTVSIDILSDAVIKGDLLFTNTHGEDYISALSKSLTKLGVTTNVGVRPTAVPSDLIKLLDHPKAGDVVLEMLVELVINRGSTAKTYAERYSSNSSRLPFVDAAFVGALLCDYERKSSIV